MLRTSRSIQQGRMLPYYSTADMPVPPVYTDVKPTSGGVLLSDSINDNCVGCWIFNEGTGTTVYDLSSAGKNGTIGGAATWSTDDKGSACIDIGSSAAGQDGNITVAHWGLIAPTTEMTIMIRQYATAAQDQSSFTCDTGAGYILNSHCPYSDGTVYWDAGNSSASRVSYNPGTTTGSWINWIFRASTTENAITIYKNGVSGTSGSASPSFSQYDVPLTIGMGIGANSFAGKIDVFRVWSRALTTGEITTLASAPYTGIG